jgi:type I restriction enzyme M protein
MKDKTNLGWKRQELLNQESNALIDFVNNELFPYLKSLRDLDDATSRQKIIGEIFSNLDKTRIDSQDNLLNILDKIHNIRLESVDTTHIFSLSQAYEGLLLKMGEKKNDGGQFFTPREITRVMITIIKPTIGETIYDPCCGTGGFLAQAYEFFVKSYKDLTEEETKFIKHNTFFGREKDNLVYPITLANLIIHGIDEPHIWHGNTLSRKAVYDGLFQGSPQEFDVILTNPPFGGKEGKDVQSQFRYQTSATQILFLQHIIEHLKPGGRCGIIVDEGVLFRTNEAFLYTKKWLLQECNLWCIISLPIGVFANAGASIKTNILFFTKGSPTNEIWYYDMSDIKISKKTPLTFELFEDFFNLFPTKKITNRSWIVDVNKLEAMKFDLKAVNPNITFVDNFGSINEIVTQIEFEMETISTLLSEANGWITHNK